MCWLLAASLCCAGAGLLSWKEPRERKLAGRGSGEQQRACCSGRKLLCPRAPASAEGPPHPGMVWAELWYPAPQDLQNHSSKPTGNHGNASSGCCHLQGACAAVSQHGTDLSSAPGASARAPRAGNHPLLPVAALWVAETLLQRQDLALSLILTWQSPTNAAPGSEPAEPGWNFTFLHRGRCSDLDMCRQHLSPAQTSLPFLKPGGDGSCSPCRSCGVGLARGTTMGSASQNHSGVQIFAAGTTQINMMGCWLGWRKHVSKPWQSGQAEENVQGLL